MVVYLTCCVSGWMVRVVRLTEADGQTLYAELQSKPKVPPKFISYRPEPETDLKKS